MTNPYLTAQTKDAELVHLRNLLRAPEGMSVPWNGHAAELIDMVLDLRAGPTRRVPGLESFQIVTLCGSTRFRTAYLEWAARLQFEESAMVFSCGHFPQAGDSGIDGGQKLAADEMHMAKIAASGSIFVLDVGGYIGESTRDEIRFATEQGVPVRRLSEEHPGWTEADCRYVSSL